MPEANRSVSPRGPLAALRVVDAATVVAGPGAARIFADYGATVVKVERPGTGDTVRSLGFVDDSGQSLWWRYIGRNKRSVVLDLKKTDDVDVFRKLCFEADVLIENFRPGVMERLGLDPNDLVRDNPKLVVCRVTGFGQSGPMRDRPGFASLAEAMGGFAALNGEDSRPPLLPPIALTDEVTALVAANAVLACIAGGNRGQVIDVSLLESIGQIMGPLLASERITGPTPRLGSGIAYTVPRGIYVAGDSNYFVISTSAEPVAQRVLGLLGLSGDDRFASAEARIVNRNQLDSAIQRWASTKTVNQVLAEFEAVDAACAPVLTQAQLSQLEHVREREMFVEVDGVLMPNLGAKFSVTPGELRWAGLMLGEATEVVRRAAREGRSMFSALLDTPPS